MNTNTESIRTAQRSNARLSKLIISSAAARLTAALAAAGLLFPVPGANAQTRLSTADTDFILAAPKRKERSAISVRKIDPQPRFQPVSERFPALEKQEVVFTFFAPAAGQVYVTGNFNRWRASATPMHNTGAGRWVARELLRSGQYEYRFVVDGRWIEDPCASQRLANSYGGFNSAIPVPLAVKTSIL
jgi:hypothetical protein